MAKIKLVLSDMDGTLVPFGRDAVDRRTLDAISALRSSGIAFGPASGREPVDLIRFFQGDASCYDTGILANGKLVRANGSYILKRPLEHESLARLGAYLSDFEDQSLLVYVPEGPEVEHSSVSIVHDSRKGHELALPKTNIALPQGVSFLDEAPDADIFTADVMSSSVAAADAIRPEIERLFPEFDFVKPAPVFFDILARGTSKATALGVLEEALSIEPDEVVFFGDSENDLALLEAVPNSIAVANGTPAAQQAARFHIADAAEDSVAAVMESIARTGELVIPAEVSRD